MLEKFSEHLRTAIAHAHREARRRVEPRVLPVHLLLGVLRTEGCVARLLLRTFDLDPDLLAARIETRAVSADGGAGEEHEIPLSPEANRLLTLAGDFSRWMFHMTSGTEHLLLAIISTGDGPCADALREAGLDLDRAYEAMLSKLQRQPPTPGIPPAPGPDSLGSVLKRMDLLTDKELAEAVAVQRREGGVLGEILVRLGYISREELMLALAGRMGLEFLDIRPGLASSGFEPGLRAVEELIDSAPVVKLLDLILEVALGSEATDLHLETFEDRCQVRYRVDGILYEMESPPLHLAAPLVDRIKMLAGIEHAASKLPQEGHFVITREPRSWILLVSILPTVGGQSAVLRIHANESRSP